MWRIALTTKDWFGCRWLLVVHRMTLSSCYRGVIQVWMTVVCRMTLDSCNRGVIEVWMTVCGTQNDPRFLLQRSDSGVDDCLWFPEGPSVLVTEDWFRCGWLSCTECSIDFCCRGLIQCWLYTEWTSVPVTEGWFCVGCTQNDPQFLLQRADSVLVVHRMNLIQCWLYTEWPSVPVTEDWFSVGCTQNEPQFLWQRADSVLVVHRVNLSSCDRGLIQV